MLFQNLSSRLVELSAQLSGRGRLTDKNINQALNEVRAALLEADVALPVVKSFVAKVKQKAIGQKVMKSLSPGQELIRIVKKELIAIMGQVNTELDLRGEPPVVILLAGLQGAGKTTTTAKLARYLRQSKKQNIMVAGTDVYRPAAMEQLKTLINEVGVGYYEANPEDSPVNIARQALKEARKKSCDVLLIDTAGRLHVDQKMMEEIKDLHRELKPLETLFVVDSMTGQDAANTAQAFNAALPLTGVILTKVDGDARGGAALSIREITGKPIKFIGVGEKTEALEPFYPERIASRILGMGDVLSLIEKAEQTIGQEEAKKIAKKIERGQFDLNDFAEQLEQMSKMGGIRSLVERLPGMGAMNEAMQGAFDDRALKHMRAIILSMTPAERRDPEIIKMSRRQRIAKGSGRDIQEVNRLLKNFSKMSKMMRKFGKKGGIMSALRSMGGGMQDRGI